MVLFLGKSAVIVFFLIFAVINGNTQFFYMKTNTFQTLFCYLLCFWAFLVQILAKTLIVAEVFATMIMAIVPAMMAMSKMQMDFARLPILINLWERGK